MITEFHLSPNELNQDFLLRIKELFKGSHRISIRVEEEYDETEHLLRSDANREILEKSIKQARAGELIEVTFPKQ